jgi:hypothetical protein
MKFLAVAPNITFLSIDIIEKTVKNVIEMFCTRTSCASNEPFWDS